MVAALARSNPLTEQNTREGGWIALEATFGGWVVGWHVRAVEDGLWGILEDIAYGLCDRQPWNQCLLF